MTKQALTNPYGPEQLASNVAKWGYDKGILKEVYEDLHELQLAQAKKTHEEVVEMSDAILLHDREEVMDAIGDIIVTLIMQAELWDTNIFECLEGAYDVISKRTGKMVDGQFVKDS